ncbi:hypothetical protein ACLB2K_038290 [Fragaria x ananassa]
MKRLLVAVDGRRQVWTATGQVAGPATRWREGGGGVEIWANRTGFAPSNQIWAWTQNGPNPKNDVEVNAVDGFSSKTKSFRSPSIGNNAGRVYMVDSEKLATLESLTNVRVTNSFVTMSSMLQWVSEVKHLFIKEDYESNFYNFYRKLAYCTYSVIHRDIASWIRKSAEVQFLQVMPQS